MRPNRRITEIRFNFRPDPPDATRDEAMESPARSCDITPMASDSTTIDLEARRRALADHFAIREAQARYSRAIDQLDFDTMESLLTEDYCVEAPEASLTQPEPGRAAAIAFIRTSTSNVRATVHQVHSPEIAIDGDTATATWAVYDRLVWEPGDRTSSGWGYYYQRWRREDGAWKLASLRLAYTVMILEPPRWRVNAAGEIVFVEEGD